jgi:hypothetical protein
MPNVPASSGLVVNNRIRPTRDVRRPAFGVDEVTGGQVRVVAVVEQARVGVATQREVRHRAAGVEPASRRRVHRTGDVAGEHDALTPPL